MKSQMFRNHLFGANKLSPKMVTFSKGEKLGNFRGLRSGFWGAGFCAGFRDTNVLGVAGCVYGAGLGK